MERVLERQVVSEIADSAPCLGRSHQLRIRRALRGLGFRSSSRRARKVGGRSRLRHANERGLALRRQPNRGSPRQHRGGGIVEVEFRPIPVRDMLGPLMSQPWLGGRFAPRAPYGRWVYSALRVRPFGRCVRGDTGCWRYAVAGAGNIQADPVAMSCSAVRRGSSTAVNCSRMSAITSAAFCGSSSRSITGRSSSN